MSLTRILSARYWFPDLSVRSLQRERMDEAASDLGLLRRTLRDFRLVNILFSRMRALTRRHLFCDIRRRGLTRVRLLDLGAGAGDYAEWFVEACRRRGVKAEAVCLDSDPRVVAYGRELRGGHPALEFVEGDAERADLPAFKADYVVANHFLHHLPDSSVPPQIERAYRAASCGLLLNDILRSAPAHAAFTVAAGLLFRNGFTLADGRASVRRGFSTSEMAGHLAAARLSGALTVGRLFPARIYLLGFKG